MHLYGNGNGHSNPQNRTARPCPGCGGSQGHTFAIESGTRYVRCRCGLVYQNPALPLEALLKSYEGYLPSETAEIEAVEATMSGVYDEARRWIVRHHSRPGTILDVGCGLGFFLKPMKDRGWDVVGCDPSPRAAAEAGRRFGIAVQPVPFETFRREPESLDVITGFYVIEHVLHPREVIRKACGLLKPGGTLLLRFPNTAPIVRWGKLLGHHDLLHAPWHLTDFTPGYLGRLLAEAGFRDVRFTVGGHTLPRDRLARMISRISARTFSWLERLNHGNWLIPGISRNVIASR